MHENTPFDEWLSIKLSNPERESYAGYHVISTFMENPYCWYLRYVRGLRPIHTKPALLKGSIIHCSIEAAYLYGHDEMLHTANALFATHANNYAESEQHGTDWRDSIVMLNAWSAAWLESDKRNWHILHLEDQFELPLPNGYIITIKPDIILSSKEDGAILIRDHKTSGWSLVKPHQDLEDGDQSTAYLWGVNKLYPNNSIIGLESDVIFKRSNMSAAKVARPGIIQRTGWYLGQWELSMISWIQTIAERVRMVEDGYPPAFAFPRGESYWGPSDWSDIYRSPLPDDPTEPPYGYQIDSWQLDRATNMLALDATTEADHA